MPKFLTSDQSSSEWIAARRGRITASRIRDVLAFNKNGSESAKRYNYRMELIAERLTGIAAEHYVTPAMEHGLELEPWAVAAYEAAFGVRTVKCGFAQHQSLDYSGATPDRLVGEDGILEVKCPTSVTHLEWLMADEIPEEHKPQMFWEMACTERHWADFVSFDDRMEEGLKFFCKRLQYDAAVVADIQAKVMQFNEEIEQSISKLRRK